MSGRTPAGHSVYLRVWRVFGEWVMGEGEWCEWGGVGGEGGGGGRDE
jgi:hypothetical protein